MTRKKTTKPAFPAREKNQILSSNPNQQQTLLSAASVSGPGIFPHGVHPPERKELGKTSPLKFFPPEKVVLPLLQHIGAPCASLVKPKQEVVFGELMAKGEGLVTAPVPSAVAGVVQKKWG